MNAIIWLIFTTALILIAGLVFSFSGMKSQVAGNPAEKDKLRKELALLDQMSVTDIKPSPAEVQTQTQAELDALKAKVEEFELQKKLQEEERLAATLEAEKVKPAPEPIEPAMNPQDERRLQRRAKNIANALIMATVEQYHEADGFATIRVINYENVQQDVILAIRRNTGIVGQLRVSTVEGEKAIADVSSHTFLAGEVDIQPGDELIIPPL